jgi:molybdate transport system ATP-binding protein
MTDSATMQLQYVLDRGRFSLNVAAEIPLHGVSGVYGESGAGKTTLLRCIAGLEQADEGELIVAGERWQGAGYNMPVHERETAYVFQEPRLFPHLNVRDNIMRTSISSR